VQETLFLVHRWLGYGVFLLLVAVAVVAFNRAKNGQEFSATPFSSSMVLVDIQVVIGLIFFTLAGAWEFDPAVAYVHPAVMLAALGVGHAGVGRARREQMAADAYRKVGRMLVIATVLLLIGIGIVSGG
jgi:heme A synthase